ncbi:MAG: hypothetical protein U0P45_17220 [Acidimicrobiales bacterium]
MSADLVRDVFSPENVDTVAADADARRGWALEYGRRLWGDHKGTACIATGRPHVNEAGKYAHRDFAHHFFAWPAEADDFASAAVDLAGQALDVYVTPMLRTARSAKKGAGAGGSWCWVDVDGEWTAERSAAVGTLGDTFTVHSGTGRHVYVALDGWYEPDEVAGLNRRLRVLLDGDHKWAENALLRVPGTYNRKPFVFDHRAPALVWPEGGAPWPA